MTSRNISFYLEKKAIKKGYKLIAGCDEVGRGSVAGPVVTGCVVFKSFKKLDLKDSGAKKIIINDSKKLTSNQRKISDKWIRDNVLSWGIGEVSAADIDKVGISKATQMAFRRAIVNSNKRLSKKIDFILFDAFYVPYIKGLRMPIKKVRKKNHKNKHGDLKISANQLAIVNGDERSISIAAASIIAKVYRDNKMTRLSKNKRYRLYDWDSNKGYATSKHKKAIKKYGITRYHRKYFLKKFN